MGPFGPRRLGIGMSKALAGLILVGLILVGMVVSILLLWPRGDPASPTTTAVAVAETTLAVESTASTSTTADPSTTSTTVGGRVVDSVEEAEAILRELWFGWFEGIYLEDENRIREVVATEEQVATAVESFGVEFDRSPSPEDLTFEGTEILRSDEECLAVWATLHLSGFRTGDTDNVHVLRQLDGRWLILSTWRYQEDLWVSDCSAAL